MKQPKTFDCIEFKEEMQRKVRESAQGLTLEERLAKLDRWLETSGEPVAVKWRSIPDAGRKPHALKA